MNCLVTGGAGFIGSHLVDHLLKLGHKVIVVDDFSTGKEENLLHHNNNNNLVIYKKDVCYDLSVIFLNEKIDIVFHLAARSTVQFSIQNPILTHGINVNATLNLLNYSINFGVKRFVFVSSAAVYGDAKKLPTSETDLNFPLSPYALHKLIGENYCQLFKNLYGLETICVRLANVYGPRQNLNDSYSGVISKFVDLINHNQIPTILGDGEQTRDFVFVGDVAKALITVSEIQNQECLGQVFNIGSSTSCSINNITNIIIKASGKDIRPQYGPAVIEIKHSLLDSSKAHRFLNWKAKTNIIDGLEETYKFLKTKFDLRFDKNVAIYDRCLHLNIKEISR